jgi:hypothetical protein
VNTENGTIGDQKVTAQIVQLPLNFRAISTSPLAAMSTSAEVEQTARAIWPWAVLFCRVSAESDDKRNYVLFWSDSEVNPGR